MKEYKRLTKKSWHDTKFCGLNEREVLNRLWEFENKIENGTIVELPCKVGDKIYVIYHSKWHCQEVWQFRYDTCGLCIKTIGSNFEHIFGENAFLTREEAEKRLKELQE